MNKSTSVRVVESSTTDQRIWEESCSLVHQVIGRQISVQAVESEGEPVKRTQFLLYAVGENRESADVGRNPWRR